jgi:hypothetical protein
MVPIARGQAVVFGGHGIIHACWLDDAEHDNGEPVVVAFCCEWIYAEAASETQAAVDCMACLVDPRRHDDEPG